MLKQDKPLGSQYAGTPPHCSCHFSAQLLITNWVEWVGVLLIGHVTSTLNSWWLMGWGSSSSLLMSLQCWIPDDQWEWVGGVLLLIAHVTSTLNSWWPIGWGGWGSLLVMSLQLSTSDDQRGWMGGVEGPPPHCSCHQPSLMQLSSETKLTYINLCRFLILL